MTPPLFLEHPVDLTRNAQALQTCLETFITRYTFGFGSVSIFPSVD